MSRSQLAARLDGVIDQHTRSLTKLVDALLDPQLDPLTACREADAMCYVLRASIAMLDELRQQLAQQPKQATGRAH